MDKKTLVVVGPYLEICAVALRGAFSKAVNVEWFSVPDQAAGFLETHHADAALVACCGGNIIDIGSPDNPFNQFAEVLQGKIPFGRVISYGCTIPEDVRGEFQQGMFEVQHGAELVQEVQTMLGCQLDF